jgi:hypothetical protein
MIIIRSAIALVKRWMKASRHRYRPEHHYMRGPGPASERLGRRATECSESSSNGLV